MNEIINLTIGDAVGKVCVTQEQLKAKIIETCTKINNTKPFVLILIAFALSLAENHVLIWYLDDPYAKVADLTTRETVYFMFRMTRICCLFMAGLLTILGAGIYG